MKYLLEISKIIEAAIAVDRRKMLGYLDQLTRKLKKDGDDKSYELLSKLAASALPNFSGAVMTSSADDVPQDKESQLELLDRADCTVQESKVFLPNGIMNKLNEFVTLADHVDELKDVGVTVAPSMLLYGPPGVGKSETAKYVAARLKIPLYTVRTDSLVSSYLGSTSKNLRSVFDFVSVEPCVLFLDELDAIAKQRDDSQELGELKRVVISLLQNIDKLKPSTVLIAATNHEHLLDPAIWRRFSYKLQLSLPESTERGAMFKDFLGKYVISPLELRRLTMISEGMSGAEIREACLGAIRRAVLQGNDRVRLIEIIKGCVAAMMPDDFGFDLRDEKSRNGFFDKFGDGRIRQGEMAKLFGVSEATISRRIHEAEVKHGG